MEAAGCLLSPLTYMSFTLRVRFGDVHAEVGFGGESATDGFPTPGERYLSQQRLMIKLWFWSGNRPSGKA
jgi:hypothetical protein